MTLVIWIFAITVLAMLISRGVGPLSTNNYFRERKGSEHINRGFFVLFSAWIAYSILFGCRQGFVDTSTYKSMAERIGADFINLFNNEVAIVEPGFNFWMILCNKISGNNSQFFIFFTTVLTLAGVFVYFYKNSSDSVFSVFFFITMFSFTYINGIRQTLVAVLFTLLYNKWKERPAIMILICIFLTLFHESALLLIPLYLGIRGKFLNWKIKLLFLFALVCVISGGQIQQLLDMFLSDSYMDSLNIITNGTGVLRVIINAIPFVLVLLQRHIHKSAGNTDEIYNIFMIDMAINVCSLNSAYFARMSIYFSLFVANYYPYIIHKVFNRNSQRIAYFLFVAFYSAFYLYQARVFENYGYLREFYLFFAT